MRHDTVAHLLVTTWSHCVVSRGGFHRIKWIGLSTMIQSKNMVHECSKSIYVLESYTFLWLMACPSRLVVESWVWYAGWSVPHAWTISFGAGPINK